MKTGLVVVALVALGALMACGRPPCQQPLSAYCKTVQCDSRGRGAAQLGSETDGGCIAIATCGSWQVRSGGDSTITSEYYNADGGLVAVAQSSEVVWGCGEFDRAFGSVPVCDVTGRKTYCGR